MSYATMKTSVQRRARNTGTWAAATVGEYLNECQQKIYEMPVDWKVLVDEDTSTATIGQENYSRPGDYGRTLSFQIETGSTTTYKLFENSYDTVRYELNRTKGSNSIPKMMCVHYQQFFLAPRPDVAYTMRLDYIRQPATMSEDSDTTVFPESLLKQYALAMFKKDLGRPEWKEEFALYEKELDGYMQINDRGPDRLDGFAVGFSGVTPYYHGANRSNYYRDNR